MATIRKRGAYQWEAQIRRRGYPAQSKTFNTKAEAEAWSKMIESEMARGVWISRGESESTTLHEALTRYASEITPLKKGAAPESAVLRVLKATPLARRPMASIRGSDVATLRDQWLQERAPATALRRLQLLSHVFTIARKEWGMESLSNPVELVRKPQPNNARTRRIRAIPQEVPCAKESRDASSERSASDEEIDRVIAASASKYLPYILRLAIETAMRRSELIGLRWKHIDLERRVAHLPSTKNGSSRDVPLSPLAVSTLGELRKNDPGMTLDDRIFNIRADAVTRAFERAVERARKLYIEECESVGSKVDQDYLIDLRFHDLRHEATSRLAEIFPLHELTKITGHKDTRMLMRYYHPRAEDLAKKLYRENPIMPNQHAAHS